jgi:hypothetical protein
MAGERRHTSNGHAFAALVERLQSNLRLLLKRPSVPKVIFGFAPIEALTDRVRICQAIRDAGLLPPDAGLYLVATALDYVAEFQSYEGPDADGLQILSEQISPSARCTSRHRPWGCSPPC